jgi:hypothetical protein
MLDTVQQQLAGGRSTRLQRMMYGALEALLELDPEAPRTSSLVQRCRVIGYDNNASSQVATALKLATSGAAPATQPLAWGQDTGSFKTISPRAPGPQGTGLRQRFAGRGPVYLAGSVVAVAVLVSAGAFITTRTDGAAPVPPQPTRAAPAPTRTVSLPPQTITLPPLAPGSRPDDERTFRQQFDQNQSPGAVPASVMLVNYGTDLSRAGELEKALKRSPDLKDVPFQLVDARESSPGGKVVATVYFSR